MVTVILLLYPFAVRNTAVGLEHVEAPADMKIWPQFHNGVAAGLRIAQGISSVCEKVLPDQCFL